ncbi:MAG: zinc-dependent peptidase [Betaproteobacteria bacterium]|nr:zinc-dependent peptidase [Betaproteobacteria bacterium]
MVGLLRTLFARPAPMPAPEREDWAAAFDLAVFHGLNADERARLRLLAEQLLAGKTFTPAGGAAPSGADVAAIAAQAALPILNLGASWYDGWREVVLYPAEFIHEMDEVDEAGVVHHMRHVRSGEAWAGGPLVLSLDDLGWSGRAEGYNVVIHEFAHKLDMANGAVDGLPALHGDMTAAEWAAAFTPAYADFRRRAEQDAEVEIDPYAAESPAEFFAVLSEYFFELPEVLVASYPAVYEQMRRFFRQNPLERFHDTAIS